MSGAWELVERCTAKLHADCGECRGEGGTSQETGHPGVVEHLPCLSLEMLRQTVHDVLTETLAAGWRVVRTEPVRPTWVERTERIAEEWRP